MHDRRLAGFLFAARARARGRGDRAQRVGGRGNARRVVDGAQHRRRIRPANRPAPGCRPSSIRASTMPAEAASRIAMTTGLCGLAEIGAKSSGFMPAQVGDQDGARARLEHGRGAYARLSACRSWQVDSSMGPSCAHKSRSGVAMSASGRFDLKELAPILLPLTCGVSLRGRAEFRTCLHGPSTSHRTGLRRWLFLAAPGPPWPVSGERQ